MLLAYELEKGTERELKSLAAAKSGLGAKSDRPVEVASSFAALTVDTDENGAAA